MNNRRIPILIFGAMVLVIAGLVFALVQLTKTDTLYPSGDGLSEANSPATVTVVSQIPGIAQSSGDFLLPDSAFINSPSAIGFRIEQSITGSYLAAYRQEYVGITYTGAEMIERTALGHSIHPKLLLAIVEYQSGWVSAQNGDEIHHVSGVGIDNSVHGGFYQEIYWAADRLAYGYYARRVGALNTVGLKDGTVVKIPEDINAASVGVYYFFSLVCDQDCWQAAIINEGFISTYLQLFGDPYADVIEPLLPDNLNQPSMQLPFEDGKIWSFTGGPHPAWGDGSAWAALDFAPPKDVLGCIPTEEWLTAVADGVIVRSEPALVVLDLDGDGYEQTGWNVLYYHVETRERITAGTMVHAGDRIGHPSCEGGITTGTHVHIARKYNGEWIPADQDLPFNLDGWLSSGAGYIYDGFMTKDGVSVEALDGQSEENQISR